MMINEGPVFIFSMVFSEQSEEILRREETEREVYRTIENGYIKRKPIETMWRVLLRLRREGPTETERLARIGLKPAGKVKRDSEGPRKNSGMCQERPSSPSS